MIRSILNSRFLTLVMCCTIQISIAQPTIQQQTPNAAALAKFAEFPVSYYTGVPQISIPLYHFKNQTKDIPITLDYHASGIKVTETPSWAGLGWALNAGGVITRSVRGNPDDCGVN